MDPACSPSSSNERVTQNNTLRVVICFPRQNISATPRLTDGVLGPDNLHSPTTDFAYTLAGLSQFGTFETWIQFDFISHVSLASVTLHYYCTGQSPQLQLSDGSGMVTPPVSPPCDSTAQIQCLTIRVNTSTRTVILEVLRNNNTIYISDVEFFTDQSPNAGVCCLRSHTNTPTTDSRSSSMEMPTPSHNQPGTLSADGITSTLPHTGQTTAMATPKTSPTDSISATGLPSNNSSAVAGAVAGVVAGLVICIAVSVLLIIACFIFKRRKLKDDGQEQETSIDNPVYEATAKDNASPEHSEELEPYKILTNPLYETGKGLKHEPTDHHLTAADASCYDVVNNDSRGSCSTGHHASPAVYDKVKTSTDTYTVPLSPDTDTYSAPTSLAHQPLAPKRTDLLGRSSHFGIQNGEINTASDRGHTYAVVDKKKEAPPPLPPPYKPGD